MAWFLNEVSFTGQFSSKESFIDYLRSILKLRRQNPAVKDGLFCSKHLPELKVSGDFTLRDAVIAQRDRDLKIQVLEWLDKKGPFIDDIRQHVENDDFEIFDKIVTDFGVGESARQKILGNYSALYSLETTEHDMANEQLVVNQIMEDLTVVPHEIANFWDLDTLTLNVESRKRPPSSWNEMLEYITEKYSKLSLSNELIEHLSPHPFSSVICKHVLFYMSVLDNLVGSRNDRGEYTELSQSILNDYFLGDGAKITNESSSNKKDYKDKMTFKDPRNNQVDIFSTWHAKISSCYFRIHFEFPLKAENKTMAICYIGPKLTKK